MCAAQGPPERRCGLSCLKVNVVKLWLKTLPEAAQQFHGQGKRQQIPQGFLGRPHWAGALTQAALFSQELRLLRALRSRREKLGKKHPFLMGLLVRLVLSCLYILDINPLSDLSSANAFSHSVGCLSGLWIVSFAVQKLFSLV